MAIPGSQICNEYIYMYLSVYMQICTYLFSAIALFHFVLCFASPFFSPLQLLLPLLLLIVPCSYLMCIIVCLIFEYSRDSWFEVYFPRQGPVFSNFLLFLSNPPFHVEAFPPWCWWFFKKETINGTGSSWVHEWGFRTGAPLECDHTGLFIEGISDGEPLFPMGYLHF